MQEALKQKKGTGISFTLIGQSKDIHRVPVQNNHHMPNGRKPTPFTEVIDGGPIKNSRLGVRTSGTTFSRKQKKTETSNDFFFQTLWKRM